MKFIKIPSSITLHLKIIGLILFVIITLEIIILSKIQPNLLGKEGVTSINQELIIRQAVDYCKSKSYEKIKCWENILEDLLAKYGLDIAYQVYEKLYEEESVFVENCHGFTHIIGSAAYQKYNNQQDFPVTSGVAYCSYGFFHGFVEAMMERAGNLKQARGFCDYIEQKLKGETWTLPSCMHGIGHGVTDGSDPRAYGNEHALIDPGLKLCEKVGKNEYEIKLCATGVFNSLAAMYFEPKYKLTLNRKDPYAFCAQFTKSSFKHACYDDFKIIPMSLENNDLSKAIHYVEAIPEDVYAADAMDNLSTYAVYWMLKDNNLNNAINICHNTQKRLQIKCITGIGAGLMTAGIPNKEYERALDFCLSPTLTDEEKDACHARILGSSSIRYSQQKFKAICKTVKNAYRKYCGG